MLNENSKVDVLIIGGGLAGLTSALHLSKYKLNVIVVEKNSYPKHKVCGEYISNEVLPYLSFLDFNPFKLGAKSIDKFELTTPKNKVIQTKMKLGGFGISRYTLDNALAEKAKDSGVLFVKDAVTEVKFKNDLFSISTKDNKRFVAKTVIGAYGKRSSLDVSLKRKFIKKESPYLAVKVHLKGDFPNDLVALHNFNGGYCGLSKVENDVINACYIVDYTTFKKYKNIEAFQEQVIYKNTALKAVFENATPLFDQPLTISQISFASKNPIENHMLMCGDTAGMIHPLCGNGMSMAISSAQMASRLIISFMEGNINRRTLEREYAKHWNLAFKSRLKTGRIVASLFRMYGFSEIMMYVLQCFPKLLPQIIKRTHGKPLLVE
ncbi:NAD(P)/FAD-dependent oxidoreductase [Algibacter mikhailovii]|uniref:FAD-dependent oxidoreductase n=1 Tax=Algibacter mikhailovii TaxID=425498 RepID=A0A918QXM9_9FLAO|nr:NAD(P)/FAD-dependent oxidoreductase [Algibacter mikhailovii]GGZ75929.1 FAD-dependent oxidoreductase [Algibacter mikhailovii]